jgi:hypothetical protein
VVRCGAAQQAPWQEDGHFPGRNLSLTLAAHLSRRGRTRFLCGHLDAGSADGPLLNFALKRLKSGELLAVASNRPAPGALKAYVRRRGIECLFGDVKSRGFNMEDTRLTDPRKLDLLMGLIALATAWVARAAIAHIWPRAPRRGTHGHFAKSRFRTGFDHLRRLLRTDPVKAIGEWRRLDPRGPLRPRVV